MYNSRKHLFSFDDVTLTYDSEARTADMSGTMCGVRSGVCGWTLDYSWGNVTDTGAGTFVVTKPHGFGSGSYTSPKGYSYGLGSSEMKVLAAFTCDGHRIPNDHTTCGLHGWVDMLWDKDINDFVATAYRQPAAVPLPAGVVLLIGALGALGLVRRARE